MCFTQNNSFSPCALNGYYKLQSCEAPAMLMGVPKTQRARGLHGATHDHTNCGTGLAKSIKYNWAAREHREENTTLL